MEEKKTFGAYILRRRKELGMTQREFAEKLYVTESAVSKWERGLSYPDITLLRSICTVLGITEHELLTGSEDSEQRASERLAAKYLRMTRRWRAVQYMFYGAILLGCFLGNVLSSHSLDWFFIALTSVMTAASVTLAPLIAAKFPQTERFAVPISAGCFALSVELLILSGCLWSGDTWTAVAMTGALLGMTAVLLPLIQSKLPLPPFWQGRKLSGYLLLETALLILLLFVCSLHSGEGWFCTAATGTIFGLGFIVVPVLLRQMPLPEPLAACRTSLFTAVQTALLILLLFAACVYSGGDWFVIASVSTLFGLGFVTLPVYLKQLLPAPFLRHKALIYFALQTLGLFVVLVCADLYSGAGVLMSVSLPVALVCLALPWGIMLVCRYLPVSGLRRASVSLLWLNAWIWLFPKAIDSVMIRAFGADHADPSYTPWPLMIPYDFSLWQGAQGAYNVFAIILFSVLAAAALLFCVDLIRRRR